MRRKLMKKISLVGCRLRDDAYLDIPTNKLEEQKISENELFALVGYEGDAWSGKLVFVPKFCDDDYQKALPLERVNFYALMMRNCKRIEGYLPNIDWTQDTLKDIYERRMNMMKMKKTFSEVKGILSSFLRRNDTKLEIMDKYLGMKEVYKFRSSIEERQIKLVVKRSGEVGAPDWCCPPPSYREFIINENNSFLVESNKLKVLDGEKVLFSIYCWEKIYFNFEEHFSDKSELKMVAKTSKLEETENQ